MVAGRYDILCDQGATFTESLAYKDSTGAIIPLGTGYTARMQVRTSFDAASPVLTLTTANGGITLADTSPNIVLLATAVTTAALTAGNYLYDLELVSGSTVTRVVMGAFTVRAEVTR